MGSYKKSVAAAIAALITILSAFGVDVRAWATPEVIGAVSSLAGAALVYFLPNKGSGA